MRAVIYVRDNHFENEEDTLDEQLRECRKYAIEHNLEVVDIYKERGQGCIDWGRKEELENLLADAEAGVFDVVIVAETSCLSLCFFELYYCFKRFWKHHIDVVTARQFLKGLIYPCQECYKDYFDRELPF